MKTKLISKSLTVLAIGLLSLSAMAEQGTIEMANIAQMAINSDEAGRMFKKNQADDLRQIIRDNDGDDDFDLSAIYCGRFMARRGLGRYRSSNEADARGTYLEVLTSDIRVLSRDESRGTVRIALEGNCYADNSGEIQRFNLEVNLNLRNRTGDLKKDTLVMTLESSD